ncbi:regulatory protein RecX [Erythrobacter ani]|uniref:Regulatory protein RecX n=1 Tax=Erythrobacter ani TaxID=2827235 RepID=A0ABS6SJF6_9SPHN|nr:RecX family transcriptional regulator [Erythrobacter ani]MBV7265092.1 RecX family transcriptional regulator [Erythrobacter ani]
MGTNSSPDSRDYGRPSADGNSARRRKKSRPLDESLLRDLALSYAARFATTGSKLEAYLARKIRERGVAEDDDGRSCDLDVPALVSRLIELGYVDDDAYARMKTRDLTSRGYGARRVEQALWAAGVEDTVREDNAPGEYRCREAAIMLATKRRFGPFGRSAEDEDAPQDRDEHRKAREKQVAAMLRAGHQYEHVRFILDAANSGDIEDWLMEARDDDDNEKHDRI